MPTYSVSTVFTDAARAKYALGAGNLDTASTITTTASYVQPIVGGAVLVDVDTATGLTIGQTVAVVLAGVTVGSYTVYTVQNPTSVALQLVVAGSVSSGNTVAAGATIAVSAPNPFSYVASFKVGLGGWLTVGVPREPDPGLTDLDIILDQTRATASKRYPDITPSNGYTAYYYAKAIGSSSIVSGSPNRLEVSCSLLNAEYNSDGVGNPVIYEIGLFDADGVMVVYGTFNGITKTASWSLTFPNILVF